MQEHSDHYFTVQYSFVYLIVFTPFLSKYILFICLWNTTKVEFTMEVLSLFSLNSGKEQYYEINFIIMNMDHNYLAINFNEINEDIYSSFKTKCQ